METKYSNTPDFFEKVKAQLVTEGAKIEYHKDEYDYLSYNGYWIMIATDRPSPWEKLTKRLLNKGQILGGIASFYLNNANTVGYTWHIKSPNQNTCVGYKCEPFLFDIVMWGNLCQKLWAVYSLGKREFEGVKLKDGLLENHFLSQPICTPRGKYLTNNKQYLSQKTLLDAGLITTSQYRIIEEYSDAFFKQGKELANNQQLMLAHTTYKFGIASDGTIRLMDKIHGPNLSHYFCLKNFHSNQKKAKPLPLLSDKPFDPFITELKNDHRGYSDVKFPLIPVNTTKEVLVEYNAAYESVTEQRFIPQDLTVDEFVNSVLEVASQKYKKI